MKFKKIVKNRKFHRLTYYLSNLIDMYFVSKKSKLRYKTNIYSLLANTQIYAEVMDRVNYYNRINCKFVLPTVIPDNDYQHKTYIRCCKEFKQANMSSTYRFDLDYYLRFFNQALELAFTMGDVIHVPSVPSIVKSRPILVPQGNYNSVLLKLGKIRHFNFVKDKISFDKKQGKLVWRGTFNNPQRKLFLQRFVDHPQCDLAQIQNKHEIGYGAFLSIKEQLHNKFVLCLEGNDVATNLKWVMSSNSLCFMPKPKYETWYMEGKLKAGFHYVELKPDYTDLEEKMSYYQSNIKEAEFITNNANQYTKLFQNKTIEDLIALLVLEKYFYFSGQLSSEHSTDFV